MFSKKLSFMQHPFCKFLASVRFAIPLMFLFAVAMIVGTVVESKNGTEFANLTVYHTAWFYFIEFCIVVTLLFAMLARVPLRKNLTGFYTIHTALITLFVGAFLTHVFGVDGMIELHKGKPTNAIRMQDDVLRVLIADESVSVPLPTTVSAQKLNLSKKLKDGELFVAEYFPFAEEYSEYAPEKGYWVSQWQVKNDRFSEKLELSNDPKGQIQSSAKLGLLNVECVKPEFFELLKNNLNKGSDMILQNTTTNEAEVFSLGAGKKSQKLKLKTPAEIQLVENMKAGLILFQLNVGEKVYKFFPRFSPLPITKHLEVDTESPYRIISLENFRKQSSVLISKLSNGEVVYGFGKEKDWHFGAYNKSAIQLPWMGFTLSLQNEIVDQKPKSAFRKGQAQKESAKNVKALKLIYKNAATIEEVWVTDKSSQALAGGQGEAFIDKSVLRLPFNMTLTEFKMDKIEGTEDPASYESFVNVSGEDKPVHIYMNNPFKAAGYTFYQSSYYQGEDGEYHSVLSVNKDPARGLKYFASLLLVTGLIIHFLIIYGIIGDRKVVRRT